MSFTMLTNEQAEKAALLDTTQFLHGLSLYGESTRTDTEDNDGVSKYSKSDTTNLLSSGLSLLNVMMGLGNKESESTSYVPISVTLRNLTNHTVMITSCEIDAPNDGATVISDRAGILMPKEDVTIVVECASPPDTYSTHDITVLIRGINISTTQTTNDQPAWGYKFVLKRTPSSDDDTEGFSSSYYLDWINPLNWDNNNGRDQNLDMPEPDSTRYLYYYGKTEADLDDVPRVMFQNNIATSDHEHGAYVITLVQPFAELDDTIIPEEEDPFDPGEPAGPGWTGHGVDWAEGYPSNNNLSTNKGNTNYLGVLNLTGSPLKIAPMLTGGYPYPVTTLAHNEEYEFHLGNNDYGVEGWVLTDDAGSTLLDSFYIGEAVRNESGEFLDIGNIRLNGESNASIIYNIDESMYGHVADLATGTAEPNDIKTTTVNTPNNSLLRLRTSYKADNQLLMVVEPW